MSLKIVSIVSTVFRVPLHSKHSLSCGFQERNCVIVSKSFSWVNLRWWRLASTVVVFLRNLWLSMCRTDFINRLWFYKIDHWGVSSWLWPFSCHKWRCFPVSQFEVIFASLLIQSHSIPSVTVNFFISSSWARWLASPFSRAFSSTTLSHRFSLKNGLDSRVFVCVGSIHWRTRYSRRFGLSGRRIIQAPFIPQNLPTCAWIGNLFCDSKR